LSFFLISIERISKVPVSTNVNYSVLEPPEAFNLVLQIGKYPEILQSAAKRLEPHIIVNYLFELARMVNSSMDSLRVKDQDPQTGQARMVSPSPSYSS